RGNDRQTQGGSCPGNSQPRQRSLEPRSARQDRARCWRRVRFCCRESTNLTRPAQNSTAATSSTTDHRRPIPLRPPSSTHTHPPPPKASPPQDREEAVPEGRFHCGVVGARPPLPLRCPPASTSFGGGCDEEPGGSDLGR